MKLILFIFFFFYLYLNQIESFKPIWRDNYPRFDFERYSPFKCPISLMNCKCTKYDEIINLKGKRKSILYYKCGKNSGKIKNWHKKNNYYFYFDGKVNLDKTYDSKKCPKSLQKSCYCKKIDDKLHAYCLNDNFEMIKNNIDECRNYYNQNGKIKCIYPDLSFSNCPKELKNKCLCKKINRNKFNKELQAKCLKENDNTTSLQKIRCNNFNKFDFDGKKLSCLSKYNCPFSLQSYCRCYKKPNGLFYTKCKYNGKIIEQDNIKCKNYLFTNKVKCK